MIEPSVVTQHAVGVGGGDLRVVLQRVGEEGVAFLVEIALLVAENREGGDVF